MIKQILTFVMILISFNAFADDPDDSGCISSLAEISEQRYNSTCASKDLFLTVTNITTDYSSAVDRIQNSSYITDESEREYRIIRLQKQKEQSKKILENKKSIIDILFSIEVMSMTLFFALCSYLVKVNMVEDLLPGNIVIMFLIVIIFLLFSQSTNVISKFAGNLAMSVGNTTHRFVADVLVKPIELDKRDLKIDVNQEVSVLLREIYKMNVCVNNNQKLLLESVHAEDNHKSLSEQSKIKEVFNRKHEVFHTFVEKSNFEGKRIIYVPSNKRNQLNLLSEINFHNCGNITFNELTTSKQTKKMAEEYRVLEEVIEAAISKDYATGWTRIKNRFLAENDKSEQLVLLLRVYANELKKAIVFGYGHYKVKNNVMTVDNFNNDNFKSILSNADKFYANVNEEVCLKNEQYVSDSKELVENFNDNSESISNYDCIKIDNEGAVSIVTDKEYDIEKELSDIESAASMLQMKSNNIFSADVAAISKEYQKLIDLFEEEIIDVYDLEKKIVDYYNAGIYALPKLLTVNGEEMRKYSQSFSVINSNAIINTDALTPYFSSAKEEVKSSFDFYKFEDVTMHFPDLVIESADPSAISQKVKEIALSNSSEETKTTDMVLEEGMFASFQKVSTDLRALTCEGGRVKNCGDILADYDHEKVYDDTSILLKNIGADMIIKGVGIQIVSNYVALFNPNGGLAGDAYHQATDAVGNFGNILATFGAVSLALGTALEVLEAIPSFVVMTALWAIIVLMALLPYIVTILPLIAIQSSITLRSFAKSTSMIVISPFLPLRVLVNYVATALIVYIVVIFLKMLFPVVTTMFFGGFSNSFDNEIIITIMSYLSLFFTIIAMYFVVKKTIEMSLSFLERLTSPEVFARTAEDGLKAFSNAVSTAIMHKALVRKLGINNKNAKGLAKREAFKTKEEKIEDKMNERRKQLTEKEAAIKREKSRDERNNPSENEE